MRNGLPADLALIDGHRAPLVLLAAGLGSRFGGIKPVAPVGPAGEPLVVLGVQQAAAAGFETIVVVVGPATEAAVSAALASHPSRASVTMAHQRVDLQRTRPWGTVDALLSGVGPMRGAGLGGEAQSASVQLDDAWSAGLVVANGDDLYGVDALDLSLIHI